MKTSLLLAGIAAFLIGYIWADKWHQRYIGNAPENDDDLDKEWFI